MSTYDETKVKFAARTEELMKIVDRERLDKDLIVCLMMEAYVQGKMDQIFSTTNSWIKA